MSGIRSFVWLMNPLNNKENTIMMWRSVLLSKKKNFYIFPTWIFYWSLMTAVLKKSIWFKPMNVYSDKMLILTISVRSVVAKAGVNILCEYEKSDTCYDF